MKNWLKIQSLERNNQHVIESIISLFKYLNIPVDKIEGIIGWKVREIDRALSGRSYANLRQENK